jgi:hypothetical protein
MTSCSSSLRPPASAETLRPISENPDAPARVRRPRWKEWLEGEVVREQLWRQGARDGHALWLDFEKFLAKTFKRTLRNAATTYSLITVMSCSCSCSRGIGTFC